MIFIKNLNDWVYNLNNIIFMNSFYSEDELRSLGFIHVGENVLLSKKTSIYSPDSITIGDNVRIDDFCILSGKISIGSNIHISAYTSILGKYGVKLEDYTGLSPRVTIYSAMDDFSGLYLIGPIHEKEYTNVVGGEVVIQKYAHVGANSIIFPNLIVGSGVVVGACSLVKESLEDWHIYAGVPAKKMKARSKDLLKFIK